GFWVTWEDFGTLTIGVSHALGSGIVDPAWPPGGPALAADETVNDAPTLLPDGLGSVIVAWSGQLDPLDTHTRLLASHILPDGRPDAAWGSGPRQLAVNESNQSLPELETPLADSTGGGLLWWADDRADAPGLYALEIDGNGAAAPGWPAKGRAIDVAPNAQASA